MSNLVPFKSNKNSNGFTLTELIAAMSLAVILGLVAMEAIVSNIKTSSRAEAIQRQREDWYRASSFIEAEIAISERVITDVNTVSIPPVCGISNTEFRLALDIRRDLPVIFYGVKNQANLPHDDQRFWQKNDNVLIRCGPKIGRSLFNFESTCELSDLPCQQAINDEKNKDYLIDTASNSLGWNILLDGLNPSAAGGGFTINNSTAKAATFALETVRWRNSSSESNGQRPRFRFQGGTFSRINPVSSFPEEYSVCDAACKGLTNCTDITGTYVKYGTSSFENLFFPLGAIKQTDNTVICGLGGGDTLSGTLGNDVIDAGSSMFGNIGAIIRGGAKGRNYLFGTTGNDDIEGGSEDDIIVGRGGSDLITDPGGQNSYLPWLDDYTQNSVTEIKGGGGLDIVFLRGNKDLFSIACSAGTCTVSRGNATLNLKSVERLVFNNTRVDLY